MNAKEIISINCSNQNVTSKKGQYSAEKLILIKRELPKQKKKYENPWAMRNHKRDYNLYWEENKHSSKEKWTWTKVAGVHPHLPVVELDQFLPIIAQWPKQVRVS